MVHSAIAPKDAPKDFDFIVVGGGTAGECFGSTLTVLTELSLLVHRLYRRRKTRRKSQGIRPGD